METTEPRKRRSLLKILGPGIVTGAADDDPSGIATYTQSGAQFGYGQLWSALLLLPFMVSVQEACARIGAVTGKGIAGVIKERSGKGLLFFVVILLLVANTINIGADIGAMAAAAQLLIPASFAFLAISFAALILILEIFLSYKKYAKLLKWLTLSLLAYPVTAFLVEQPWRVILNATFIPHLEFSVDWLFIIMGVFGTTITPYMFFWEASQEVEEEKSRHLIKKKRVFITPWFIRELRLDNFIGMLASQAVMWCIVVVGATVLHANGVVKVETAADAARALEPLVRTFPDAGFWAKVIFAIGVIGLGLLAVPILSGSVAYALSEAFNWREGLNLKWRRAHGFYGVIVAATLVGLFINFIGINPIRALVITAVINGMVSVPLIFVIGSIAADARVMGKYRSGRLSRLFVMLTGIMMLGAMVALIYSSVF